MSSLAPCLLIAALPLGDPNFDHSVVLLAAHGADGAFGWVINGREIMSMGELLSRAEVGEPSVPLSASVRLGGPVAPDQVWLVYRQEDRLEKVDGQFDVTSGITASASKRTLEVVAASGAPPDLLAFLGYAGWGPSQLEGEIRAGAWLPTDIDPELLFATPREEIWRRAYDRIGANPIAFAGRVIGSA